MLIGQYGEVPRKSIHTVGFFPPGEGAGSFLVCPKEFSIKMCSVYRRKAWYLETYTIPNPSWEHSCVFCLAYLLIFSKQTQRPLRQKNYMFF